MDGQNSTVSMTGWPIATLRALLHRVRDELDNAPSRNFAGREQLENFRDRLKSELGRRK